MSEPNDRPEVTALSAPTPASEVVSIDMLRYKEELAEKMGLPSPYGMTLMKQVASDLVASGYVPKHWANNPMAVYLAAMRGREMGLSPMEAVIETFWAAPGGRLGMYAGKMLDLMHRSGVKSRFVEESPVRCEILFTPPGDHEPYTAIFEIEEAKAAGLVKSDSNWVKWPSDMCKARAISRAWRALAGSFKGSANMYSKEELEDLPAGDHASEDQRRADSVGAAGDFKVGLKVKQAEPVVSVLKEELGKALEIQKEAYPEEVKAVAGKVEYWIHLVMKNGIGDEKFVPIKEPPQTDLTVAELRARALANEHMNTYVIFKTVDGKYEKDPPDTVRICNPPAENQRLSKVKGKQQTPPAEPARELPTLDLPPAPESKPEPVAEQQSAPAEQQDPKYLEVKHRFGAMISKADPGKKIAARTWVARFQSFIAAYLGVTVKGLPKDFTDWFTPIERLERVIQSKLAEFSANGGPEKTAEAIRESDNGVVDLVTRLWPQNTESIHAYAIPVAWKCDMNAQEFELFLQRNGLDAPGMYAADWVAFFRVFLLTREAVKLSKMAKDHNLSISEIVKEIESKGLLTTVEKAGVKALEAAIEGFALATRNRATAPAEAPLAPAPAPPAEKKSDEPSLFDNPDDWAF